jgi:hypothetical protein
MPTFCRHNRFLERCPICSKPLAGGAAGAGAPGSTRRRTSGSSTSTTRRSASGLRVRREGRAAEDGYSSELVPGLKASADAQRLAEEIAFSSARLGILAVEPPGLYSEARAAASSDLERAIWICFLIAYLSPLQEGDPFAGVEVLLALLPSAASVTEAGEEIDLSEIPLGPRTSHEPRRGVTTLLAYREWLRRGSGADAEGFEQARIFTGDDTWTPERRFERLFERLALPGLNRASRFELLVTLGRLGLFEMRPDGLHVGAGRGVSGEDQATVAAKRVFGIGDPLLLERRAGALAAAASVPVEALDVALAGWGAGERANLGVAPETADPDALERITGALGL